MTNGSISSAPDRTPSKGDWEHYQLYKAVRETISSLPVYFRTETHISGILATDLHTLNTVLGATIEDQVVRTLNMLRNTWDPNDEYALYSFVRQAQTFPDVLLRRTSSDEIILGIELKGWYLLAKEAEPSLRFQTTAAACSDHDLIVVVPWVLGNIISGSPILFDPFVESAKYAAEYRNYHWQHVRDTKLDTNIEIPAGVGPYPSKSDHILDKPRSDGGGNFGRLARTGMMDSYIQKLNQIELCGIKAIYWRQFLKTFQENVTDVGARRALDRLKQRVQQAKEVPSPKAQSAVRIIAELELLLDLTE